MPRSAEKSHKQQAEADPQQAVAAQGLRRFFHEFPHDAAHHAGEERPEGSFKRKAKAKGAKDGLQGGSHAGMMTVTGRFVKDGNRLRRHTSCFPACRPKKEVISVLLLCAATAAEMLAAVPAGALSYSEADFPLLKPIAFRLGKEGGVACVTGVGPVNAALGMGIVLAQCAAAGQQLRAVINVGLAGSFDLGRWPLGSLHVVREEIWPEYGLHDGRQVVAQAFGFPQWSDGRREVRDRLTLAGPAELGLALRGGGAALIGEAGVRSLTVAGVSASVLRVQHLRQLYGAALENMEGFAVAYAAARAGLPCLEVRSVSNKVGPRTAEEKDFPGALLQLGRILPALNLV